MGVFDDFDQAEASGGGNYVYEGVYIFRLVAMALKQTRNKGQIVPIELHVLETLTSYPQGRICDIDGETELPESRKPGERCSSVLLLEKQEPALGNLKSAIKAFLNLDNMQIVQMYAEKEDLKVDDPKTVKAAWKFIAEWATGGEGKALAGAICVARARRIAKKNGEPFTKIVWEAATKAQWETYAPPEDKGEAQEAAA